MLWDNFAVTKTAGDSAAEAAETSRRRTSMVLRFQLGKQHVEHTIRKSDRMQGLSARYPCLSAAGRARSGPDAVLCPARSTRHFGQGANRRGTLHYFSIPFYLF